MSDDTICGHVDDEFAGFFGQAVDGFLGHVLLATFENVKAGGERDYLDGDDLYDVYRHVARVLAGHHGQPPRMAQVVEACRRLNIPVQI